MNEALAATRGGAHSVSARAPDGGSAGSAAAPRGARRSAARTIARRAAMATCPSRDISQHKRELDASGGDAVPLASRPRGEGHLAAGGGGEVGVLVDPGVGLAAGGDPDDAGGDDAEVQVAEGGGRLGFHGQNDARGGNHSVHVQNVKTICPLNSVDGV